VCARPTPHILTGMTLYVYVCILVAKELVRETEGLEREES